MKKKLFLLFTISISFTIGSLLTLKVKAAVGEWIGDYCTSCGTYGTAGKCDSVTQTNIGLFRVSFYLNGEKIGTSVNISSSEYYQNLAQNAKWHWGDGKTDIVSYASGQLLGNPTAGGLDTIVINGISVSNVQNKLRPSKNSKNVQKILNEAGITKFRFKNGKIYYTPYDGVCEEDYQIQMVVESMQVINWLCTTDGLDNHRWIGTPYELNNGLLQQGYDSSNGGNGYMSGSIVDKTLLSSLRIDENVKIGDVEFTSVNDCLTTHIRGYEPKNGYGFNVYDLTGEIKTDCEQKCCVPCNTENAGLINAIASGKLVCDSNNCAGEEEFATGIDTDGNLVCKPNSISNCCIPSFENDYCCKNIENICNLNVNYNEYYNLYCNNNCKYNVIPPKATTGVCTIDDSKTLSEFVDGYFGKTYSAYRNLFYQGKNKIYEAEISSTYCETYCQEKVVIQLPKNYPYVNAGRYFNWTITDSEDSLIKEQVFKDCATNIELDKWYNDYKNKLDLINNSFDYVDRDTSVTGITTRAYKLIDDYNSCIGNIKPATDEEKKEFIDGLNMDDLREKTKEEIDDWNNKLEEAKKDYSDDSSWDSSWDTYFGCDVFHPACFNDLSSKSMDDDSVDDAVDKKVDELFHASRVSVCVNMLQYGIRNLQTLASARGDTIEIDVIKYSVNYQVNNTEPTLHNLISQLKKCQYEDNPLEGTSNSFDEYANDNLKNLVYTDLNLNLNYQTYLSEKNYSNDDMDKNSSNVQFSKNGGCNLKNNNESCNSKNIFESNYCEVRDVETSRYDGEGQRVYGLSFIPSILGDGSIYSKKQNILNNWKSYIFLQSSVENDYKLKKNINACVCKDGTVIDALEDGSCECPDMNSVTEIINDISNQYSCYFEWKTTYYYTTIENGNLSVEYMNPTGLYPLQLDYFNIGTNGGHFSNLMRNGIFIAQRCQSGICYYSDEDGKCYFIVNNEIITDGGKIEDNICPDGNCDDDDKCTEGDCSNYCEVGHCSNDSSIGGMELIYRQVDLNNPFPDREPGKNWQGYENIIISNREVEGSKLYSSKLEPIYSITMTPATIKEIRKVNEALNYDYSSIGTMIFDKEKITGGVSYILRGSLKNIAESTGGTFTINLNDANTDGRFDEIMNNPSIDSSGNLTTCREIASEVIG